MHIHLISPASTRLLIQFMTGHVARRRRHHPLVGFGLIDDGLHPTA